jgi:hypothetical protein
MKTETELKGTWCPWMDGRQYLTGSEKGSCACIGLDCSQCVDGGAVYETRDVVEDTDTGKLRQPDGEGWKMIGGMRSKDHRWQRETGERHAYCGRNIGEALRQELSGLAFAIENINNPRR